MLIYQIAHLWAFAGSFVSHLTLGGIAASFPPFHHTSPSPVGGFFLPDLYTLEQLC
jgi:hypothetical protein